MKSFDVAVPGGPLRVFQSGHGTKIVLGLHGLADNHLSMAELARGLDDSYTFLTPDLRGRGASCGLPGPYGLDVHAADCAKILDHLGIASAVVVGHSMGALIAERLAAQRPNQIRGLLLIDGGIVPPAEFPAVSLWLRAFLLRWMIRWRLVNVERLIASLVGPVLDNLRRTFATEEAYFDIWRNHPAFRGIWNDNLRARFKYDLIGEAPVLRSRISATALREDFANALSNMKKVAAGLREVRCPVRLVRATRGILDQPEPMISDALVAGCSSTLPQLKDIIIPDTNHISIVHLDHAIRQIATLIEELSTEQPPA